MEDDNTAQEDTEVEPEQITGEPFRWDKRTAKIIRARCNLPTLGFEYAEAVAGGYVRERRWDGVERRRKTA